MSEILKTLATADGLSKSKSTDEIQPIVDTPPLPFTSEQCQRFEFYTETKPTAGMKDIPKDLGGLGYEWYPVVITSHSTTELETFVRKAKIVIRPCINVVQGPDLKREISHSDEEIIKHVSINAVNIGYRSMGHHLGINERFFDPQEVIDAIFELRSNKDHHFVCFIYALDTIEITIDGKTFYFDSETRGQQKSTNFIMNGKIYPRYEEEARIFNSIFKIYVGKNNTEPYEFFNKFNQN